MKYLSCMVFATRSAIFRALLFVFDSFLITEIILDYFWIPVNPLEHFFSLFYVTVKGVANQRLTEEEKASIMAKSS